jgi:hypothetical protein
MKVYLATVAALHVFFMLAELLPWRFPFVLRKTNEKLAPTDKLNSGQSKVVANIVRNAGIYNGIVSIEECNWQHGDPFQLPFLSFWIFYERTGS